MNLKTVMVDGLPCNMEDQAAAIVQKTLAALNDQVAKLTDQAERFKKKREEEEEENEDSMKKLGDSLKAKDAEITTLKTQLKDAEMTPEKLDSLVTARQTSITQAKAILGDKLKTAGVSISDIQKQVVEAKLGDAAKGWDANQIAASFNTLVASTPKAAAPPNNFQRAVSAFATPQFDAADPKAKAYADAEREAENAWRGEQKKLA